MDEVIRNLKKYDLHCHLDGSLSKVTIGKLAKAIGKTLPDADQLSEILEVQPDCTSLIEYLKRFKLPLSCLVTKDNFRIAVRDLLSDAAAENVVYMEIRFAPYLSVHETLTARDIIEGALEGLKEGREKYHIDGNLILCGMRHMPLSRNIELVEHAREYLREGVCAVDLAGDESGYPVMLHADMFEKAKRLNVPFTIHAGECGSVQSIRDALALGTTRIGHGVAAQKDEELIRYCASRQICFEMCPTSNLQTHAAESMETYPFMRFLEAGIPITVNTDNRTVSNTTVTKELELLQRHYRLTQGDLVQLMKNAERAAFVSYM